MTDYFVIHFLHSHEADVFYCVDFAEAKEKQAEIINDDPNYDLGEVVITRKVSKNGY